MTMLYNNNNIYGLDGFGITDVFKIDTNIDGDFESFCIEGNEAEILDIIMVLSEEKMLNIRQGDILAGDPYNSIDSWQQFSKEFSQEQLESKTMINKEHTDRLGTTLSDVVKSLQDYGIKVERLMDNFLIINEKVINFEGDELWEYEEDSDGGFFNSLFGVYNKEIAYSLIDSDPIMQWVF